MPDIVFVRANPNLPIREGDAVSAMPSALTGPSGYYPYTDPRIGGYEQPSGDLRVFATGVLSGRFRNVGYYYGVTGNPPDNPNQPTF